MKLQEIRHKAKLNTKQFGASIGVSSRTVEGWEGGKPIPKPIRLLVEIMFNCKVS